ncbi:MAG: bifunctional DNA-formamidopyrimidine glycosylase/DNA-(apurinic or apyrimidinic site) lyase [Bryobacteraceae bacterium]|nr:bifunctional DNA-formamidopyrimidine glycosylase/DNA-(apurinic or apyrimidinic site) lyase [Bryobacteraceae bacterium]
MPELPEVEALCRRLAPQILRAEIAAAKILRPRIAHPQKPAAIERKLAGRRIEAVARRGKHILLHLDAGLTLRVHLGMTGNLFVVPDHRFRPHATRFYAALADGRGLLLEDSRVFGKVSLFPTRDLESHLPKLGPEPLDPAFTPESFIADARRTRKPAKLFLMDQSHVAGLGNIYAAESLFEARINPRTPANTLSPARLRRLHAAILQVVDLAVQSCVLAYATPGRFVEGEAYPVAVYDREGEPCRTCGALIRRIDQGGRSTYYCPRCQKR